jgi:pyrimidine-nucleoside phosphorylase
MRAVDVLRKKRDGHALDATEIEAFVHGVTSRQWPEYQTAALLMAIVLRGMDAGEIACLTRAMLHSGARFDLSDLPGSKVDKHSTGGVGDKTSLILAPLAAACGVVVPMMSGRGLGHSGGTLDKLEAIPGFRVGLTFPEFHAALRQVGCALIGQTAEIAPADKILYALRDVTATVESIPLITASIMSKKIAEGIDALVMDVKCGRGAFMKTRADAHQLAQSLVATGKANGVRTTALVTAMDAPLGKAVGNALEVIEALETLKGRGPSDLESLSVTLAAHMVVMGGQATTLPEAETRVRNALTSGHGLETFRAIIVHQGGDPRVVDDYGNLPSAPRRALVPAERSGYVLALDAELIGRATMVLGAGRDRVEDAIDAGVGAILLKVPGEAVQAGEPLLELHYREPSRLGTALTLVKQACVLGDSPSPLPQQILEILGEES